MINKAITVYLPDDIRKLIMLKSQSRKKLGLPYTMSAIVNDCILALGKPDEIVASSSPKKKYKFSISLGAQKILTDVWIDHLHVPRSEIIAHAIKSAITPIS